MFRRSIRCTCMSTAHRSERSALPSFHQAQPHASMTHTSPHASSPPQHCLPTQRQELTPGVHFALVQNKAIQNQHRHHDQRCQVCSDLVLLGHSRDEAVHGECPLVHHAQRDPAGCMPYVTSCTMHYNGVCKCIIVDQLKGSQLFLGWPQSSPPQIHITRSKYRKLDPRSKYCAVSSVALPHAMQAAATIRYNHHAAAIKLHHH